MKKVTLLFILMMFILSGCSETKKEEISNTAQPTVTDTQQVTETVIQNEATVQNDDFNLYTKQYNLNNNDLNTLRKLYKQVKSKYLLYSDSYLEEYSRKPIIMNCMYFVYDGKNLYLLCAYIPDSENKSINDYDYFYYVTLKSDKEYNIKKINKDLSHYVEESKEKSSNELDNAVISVVQMETSDESGRIRCLCEGYSVFKEARQEKYADLDNNSENYEKKLNREQKSLFNNILNSSTIWEVYNGFDNSCKDKTCIYINIWNLNNGKAELLCTHGTVDSYSVDSMVSYTGAEHGYFIDSKGAKELNEKSTNRLKRDLEDFNNLYWNNTWSLKSKKENLAKYIYNNMN